MIVASRRNRYEASPPALRVDATKRGEKNLTATGWSSLRFTA